MGESCSHSDFLLIHLWEVYLLLLLYVNSFTIQSLGWSLQIWASMKERKKRVWVGGWVYLISYSICIEFLSYSLYSFLENIWGSVRGVGSLPGFHSKSPKLEYLILKPKLSTLQKKETLTKKRGGRQDIKVLSHDNPHFWLCLNHCLLHMMNNSKQHFSLQLCLCFRLMSYPWANEIFHVDVMPPEKKLASLAKDYARVAWGLWLNCIFKWTNLINTSWINISINM